MNTHYGRRVRQCLNIILKGKLVEENWYFGGFQDQQILHCFSVFYAAQIIATILQQHWNVSAILQMFNHLCCMWGITKNKVNPIRVTSRNLIQRIIDAIAEIVAIAKIVTKFPQYSTNSTFNSDAKLVLTRADDILKCKFRWKIFTDFIFLFFNRTYVYITFFFLFQLIKHTVKICMEKSENTV